MSSPEPYGPLARALRTFLPGRRSAETLSLFLTATLVGGLTGLAATGFDLLVRRADRLLGELPARLGADWGSLALVAAPALGGLLVAPIVVRWAPDARGSGIPGVMYAVSNLGGRVSRALALWRPLATTLSIGSGASLGTEGPVVQLGASLASLLATPLRLNAERRRTLVAVAAAGGIAATFNAPIAGVLFAVEVILGEFQARYFATIVVGAVTATAVSRTLLGDVPAFLVPSYRLESAVELPLYLLLGVVCAAAAVLFARALLASENVFARARIPAALRPAAGGLIVGLLALAVPDVLGRGYHVVGTVLQGGYGGAAVLLALALAKTAATGASFGSWASGGVFAPVLFVGAALGSAFGQLSEAVFPALVHDYGAFALVGMAAVLSGVTRAPMSSIVMIFEMSGSYSLILPLLLAAVVATLVTDILGQESIYTVILSRRGQSLVRLREIDLLQTVRVSELMDEEVPWQYEDVTLGDLGDAMARTHHHGFVLHRRDDPGRLTGIVTLTDLERARRAGRPTGDAVASWCTREVATALPQASAGEVLERMAELGIGRMPVVDPGDGRRVLGFVRQADLARAYYTALERERQREQASEALRLRDLTGQDIVEVRVSPDCPLAGMTLAAARLPQESIVVALRRRGRTLFPHGDTTLEPGDTVVASVAHGHVGRFRELFQAGARRGADPEP